MTSKEKTLCLGGDKMNKKLLITMCVALWTAVVLFAIIALDKWSYYPEKIPVIIEETQIEETVEEEPEEKTLLQKALEISKDLYAVDIAHAVNISSSKYNVPIYVIYAIIATESGHVSTSEMTEENFFKVNVDAKSHANCYGLMQISKYALDDYNKNKGTKYSLNDLFNIYVNIDVGTWYYSQFYSVSENFVEQYVIYNVGYGHFQKRNPNYFYGWDDKWYSNYRNKFFYMNNLMPPTTSYEKGLYGKKNILPPYNAKKRFEKSLEICYHYFFN